LLPTQPENLRDDPAFEAISLLILEVEGPDNEYFRLITLGRGEEQFIGAVTKRTGYKAIIDCLLNDGKSQPFT
jgi:hypothetical protein